VSERTGVLYIANSAKLGGGDRVLIDLISHLDRSRFTPWLLVPGEGQVSAWATANQINFRVIPDTDRSGRLGLLRRTAPLTALMIRHRIRIVHAGAHTCYRAAGLAGLLAGAVRVCHLGFPPAPGELEWAFQFGPEAVIACHQRQAKELEARIHGIQSTCRIVAIPNGVDIDAHADGHKDVERWRFSGRQMVLIVGHLSEVKGYPTFIRAAHQIAKELPDCQFVALGGETTTPGYLSYLEGFARDLGIADRIHFVGWRQDVPEILRAADVMVLPSQAEGLSLAILEAMAAGLPVVATDVGGTSEAVLDGETGFLIPPDDPRALSEAVLVILRDPEFARRLGDAGRRRAAALFSLERVVKSVEDLYGQLLRKHA
jgi:glycosyltransferase involved in cell wall biosynthesis